MTQATLADELRQHAQSPWYGATLQPAQWELQIPAPVLAELDQLVASSTHLSVQTSDEGLAATVTFVALARRRLLSEAGVVVVRGLPFERWGRSAARTVIGTLAPMLAPLMQQSHDGTVFYDVRDTGAIYRPGVRRSVTNAPQPFHTDGPWVAATARFIGLHCLQPSASGGVSRCIHVTSLLDDLAQCEPQLYQRLSEPLPWHRQGEHAPDESPVAFHPLWWLDAEGRRMARLYTDYVHAGARAAGVKLDELAVRALDKLEELATEPHRWLEFTLGAGDCVWINNRTCAHARTGFDATGSARHLVRTWHREGASPALDD